MCGASTSLHRGYEEKSLATEGTESTEKRRRVYNFKREVAKNAKKNLATENTECTEKRRREDNLEFNAKSQRTQRSSEDD